MIPLLPAQWNRRPWICSSGHGDNAKRCPLERCPILDAVDVPDTKLERLRGWAECSDGDPFAAPLVVRVRTGADF